MFMELTWVKGSTSWFWIQANGKNIHFDPSYSGNKTRGPEMDKKADLILITHVHRDHFQKETVTDLQGSTTAVIAPSTVAKKLGGTDKVTVVEPGKELDLGWAKVRVVYAYNLGLRGHILHKKGKCVGYLVTVEGKTIYHAGDTDLIPEMKQLGHVDIALLPIGGTFTMDVDDAAEAAKAIGVKFVVPMHNLRTPVSELKSRLDKDPGIKVILAEKGKAFEPF
jgi:L-ascorbate metabolism protein UlaG (beta-lactamase superfamily)